MLKQDYSLYKRDNGIYYAQYYDKVTNKRKKITTNCKTRKKAIEFMEKNLCDGKILTSDELLFSNYFKDWFVEGVCPYDKDYYRNTGEHLSNSYMRQGRIALNKYILPHYGSWNINSLTPLKIDDWKFSLVEEREITRKTANNYLGYLSIMLEYAVRHEVIESNPCKNVKRLRNDSKPKGLLTDIEVHKLFSAHWDNDMVKTLNYTAMLTGMRLGEILALVPANIKDGYIHVEHSYAERVGIKCTKTGNIRDVPIPERLEAQLKPLFRGPFDFIFTFDGEKPLYQSLARKYLYRAMDLIGIDYRSRNITFHSWRHYLNSKLRASGVSDAITKAITGHATNEMMEHYTHISRVDMQSISSIQKLLG